jgi:hypothetical protein
MKILLVISLFFTVGCSNLQKKKQTLPPSVSTAEVVRSLEDTKTELVKAGESNTVVAKKIDTALTLAERLEKLLEQIEKEQLATKGEEK